MIASRRPGSVATVAIGTVLSMSPAGSPAAASTSDVCSIDIERPGAAFALVELQLWIGPLAEVCGDDFATGAADAAAVAAVEPDGAGGLDAGLAPVGEAQDDVATTLPTDGSVAVTPPASAGAAAIVDAGLVADEGDLDPVRDATIAYCTEPGPVAARDLAAAAAAVADPATGWTPTRIAVTMVGEQCAAAIDDLVGDVGLAS